MKRLICALAALSISLSAFAGATDVSKAVRLYEAGMYTEAAALLEGKPGAEAAAYRALCALAADTENASERAGAFLSRWPEDVRVPQVRLALGEWLFDRQRYEEAAAQLMRISAGDLYKAQMPAYLYKKGYSALKSGDAERGRNFLNQCQRETRSDYTAPAQYALGYDAYSAGRFREAIRWFDEAKSDPRFTQIANYYIFECRFNEKQYQWVVDHGEALYDKVPADRQPHMARLMSEAYLVLGDKEKAGDYYLKQLERRGEKTRADYFYAGSVLYAAEDWQGAVENFTRMGEPADSLFQVASYQLGHSYIQLKNKVAALDAFKAAAALTYSPDIQDDAAYNYAKLAFDLNGDTSAFDDYMHQFNAFSKGDQIYSYIAMSALQKHDYEAAVAAYDHIDELESGMRSNYMKAYFLRAVELMESGSYRAAVPHLKAASYYSSKQDPFNQLARYCLAECYYRDARYQEARTILTDLYNRTALHGKKEGDLVSYQTAYTYFAEGDYARARKWFENYLEGNAEVYGADAETRIGDCYFYEKDYPTAIRAYERKLNDYPDPNDIYPAYRAGVACGLIRDFQAKTLFLERVKQASPDVPYYSEALYELGRAYVATGEDEDAVRTFRTLRTNTRDPEYATRSLLELGMIARNRGDDQAALGYYKQVVDEQGSHSEDALLAIESIYQTRQDPEGYLAYVNQLGDKAHRSDAQKEKMYFSTAEQIFLSGDYAKASKTLQSYLEQYPTGAHSSEAEFYLAESSRLGGEKERAADLYEKALKDGLEGSFAETARLRFAEVQYELGNYGKAYGSFMALRDIAKLDANREAAATGMMRSAFKAREYPDAAEAARSLLSGAQGGFLREVRYVLAKSYLGSSQRDKALPLLEELAKEPSLAEGAESAYLLIQDQYDRAAFDGLDEKVYDFAAKAGGQNYWLAKAYIVLGDSFAERGLTAQARQTFESIRDGYTPTGTADDVLDQVALRLKKL